MEVHLSPGEYATGLKSGKKLWAMRHFPPAPTLDEINRRLEGVQFGGFVRDFYRAVSIDPVASRFDNPEYHRIVQSKLDRNEIVSSVQLHDDSCAAKVDLMRRGERGGVVISDVVATTGVEKDHVPSLAFMVHLARKAGYRVVGASLIHLNAEYVFDGSIDIGGLIRETDLTDDVLRYSAAVPHKVPPMLNLLEKQQPPVEPSSYVPVLDDTRLPANHIFTLPYSHRKTPQLAARGTFDLCALEPDWAKDHLSPTQWTVFQAASSQRGIVHQAPLRQWGTSLRYPLHYFDFECLATAIPFLTNTRPYQQIPFMFSCDIVEECGSVKHREFCYTGKKDPRPAVVHAMQHAIESSGSIVAYNAEFERTRIEEMARDIPELAGFLNELPARMVDLYAPFRSFYIYHPEQRGKTSLKTLMSVIAGFQYDTLDIANGAIAGSKFLNAFYAAPASPEEQAALVSSLCQYCGADTASMRVVMDFVQYGIKKGTIDGYTPDIPPELLRMSQPFASELQRPRSSNESQLTMAF